MLWRVPVTPERPFMSDTDEQSHPTGETAPPALEGGKSRNRRGGGKRARSGEASDGTARPPKMRNDRFAMAGYGDGVERAMCCGMIPVPPKSYPVQARSGVAIKVPSVVGRRASMLLLCDSTHDGPHIWPDGEVEGEPGLRPAPAGFQESAGT